MKVTAKKILAFVLALTFAVTAAVLSTANSTKSYWHDLDDVCLTLTEYAESGANLESLMAMVMQFMEPVASGEKTLAEAFNEADTLTKDAVVYMQFLSIGSASGELMMLTPDAVNESLDGYAKFFVAAGEYSSYDEAYAGLQEQISARKGVINFDYNYNCYDYLTVISNYLKDGTKLSNVPVVQTDSYWYNDVKAGQDFYEVYDLRTSEGGYHAKNGWWLVIIAGFSGTEVTISDSDYADFLIAVHTYLYPEPTPTTTTTTTTTQKNTQTITQTYTTITNRFRDLTDIARATNVTGMTNVTNVTGATGVTNVTASNVALPY